MTSCRAPPLINLPEGKFFFLSGRLHYLMPLSVNRSIDRKEFDFILLCLGSTRGPPSSERQVFLAPTVVVVAALNLRKVTL